jgi:excisionase family DNA binding protein
MTEQRPYFRISEVVKVTKVGNTTIRRWIEKKKIKAIQPLGLAGCKWAIPASEVERLTLDIEFTSEVTCQGTRLDGQPCKAWRMAGSRFCYQHQNQE